MMLSILIPSLHARAEKLSSLLGTLRMQIENNFAEEKVEIIIDVDRGERNVGAKRNSLLASANGDYLCFVDDDDRVSPQYISLLLNAIQSEPDCCSLNGLLTTNGKDEQLFRHSIHYNGWYTRGGILYRYTNHLNCVRSEIAKKMTFPQTNFGEDKHYSNQLMRSRLLKRERKIEPILYYYDYVKEILPNAKRNLGIFRRHR
jgi:glycosyltransferase involved in cell wall biosynthesis